MPEQWSRLCDAELRYLGHTWRPTGAVDVLERGRLLACEARQADDAARDPATLQFGVVGDGGSPNPGDRSDHVPRLDREGSDPSPVVRTPRRTDRHTLERLTYGPAVGPADGRRR